jgi:hypothetical protein
MRMRVGMAAAGLVVAVLAGCGGDGGDGGEGGDGGANATTESGDEEAGPTCDLLSIDRVSELFGTEATVQPPEPGATDVASSCIWQAEVGDADEPAVYQLQLTIYPGGAFYDPAMWGGTPEPVEALGDEAFVVRDGGAQGTTAGYRDAERSVFLSYAVLIDPAAADPSEQADDVVSLLRDVDAGLR